MSGPSRRLRASLGDSWGDAEYLTESDDGASIHSTSDFEADIGSDGNDLDGIEQGYLQEHHDIVTPLPSRLTRASSREPQSSPVQTPVKTPVRRVASRHSQSPRSTPHSYVRSTPGSDTMEPSFIMPSMRGSMDGSSTGSPLRSSQVRLRKTHETNGSPTSRSRTSSRRSSAQARIDRPDVRSHDYGLANQRRAPSSTYAEEEENPGPLYYLHLFRRHVFGPLIKYLLTTVGYAGYWLQPILGLGLAVGLVLFAIFYASSMIQPILTTALAPVCLLPGSSLLPICATVSRKQLSGQPPPFEDLLDVQSTFEDVLSSSKDTSSLPFTMRDSEIAIRDVRVVVRHSKLPSRAELENELDNFLATAKEASGDLIRYNSKLGFMTDKLISTNKWTRDVLRGVSEREAGTGALARFMDSINPLSVFIAPAPTLQQQIFEQYVKHISRIRDDIIDMIKMAEALLAVLNAMEDRLDGVSNIAQRDGMEITANRDELLSRLWTKLGGNSATRKEHEKKLQILTQVLRYKRVAATHIGDTLDKLRNIASQLENLRDAAAAPEIVGWREDIPWTLHLEDIEKQTERLQNFRGEQLQVEHGQYRKVMDNAKVDGGLPAGADGPVVYARQDGIDK